MKNTSHLQTPAVRRKRIAAIRMAFKRKRAEAAKVAPVIAYAGERRKAKPKAPRQNERIQLAQDLVTVIKHIVEGE